MFEPVAHFIGQVARPTSIIVANVTAGVASIIMALKVENGNDGALLMGAVGVWAGGIYVGKAVEVWKTKQADAKVEIAKATGGTP